MGLQYKIHFLYLIVIVINPIIRRIVMYVDSFKKRLICIIYPMECILHIIFKLFLPPQKYLKKNAYILEYNTWNKIKVGRGEDFVPSTYPSTLPPWARLLLQLGLSIIFCLSARRNDCLNLFRYMFVLFDFILLLFGFIAFVCCSRWYSLRPLTALTLFNYCESCDTAFVPSLIFVVYFVVTSAFRRCIWVSET